jgi:hypothetical protein
MKMIPLCGFNWTFCLLQSDAKLRQIVIFPDLHKAGSFQSNQKSHVTVYENNVMLIMGC